MKCETVEQFRDLDRKRRAVIWGNASLRARRLPVLPVPEKPEPPMGYEIKGPDGSFVGFFGKDDLDAARAAVLNSGLDPARCRFRKAPII